jgi:hypothetical protein
MNRRQYLAGGTAVTAVALAGCVGSLTGDGTEFRAAEDPWSQDNDRELSNGYEYSGLVTLPEGTYAQISGSPQVPFTINLAAEADTSFDVFVLDETEFNRYRDQEEFQYFQQLSGFGEQTIRFEGGMPAGKYYAVFDNTAFTETQPDGKITANYTVRQTVG